MTRHLYRIKSAAVIAVLIKSFYTHRRIFCIGEQPGAVQTLSERPLLCLLFKIGVVRMCRDPVYGKNLRILKPRKLRFFAVIYLLLLSSFQSYPFTEPVIPATNCFCIRKKINAVGIVAITTATIIIP